jgi:hypothetical protein
VSKTESAPPCLVLAQTGCAWTDADIRSPAIRCSKGRRSTTKNILCENKRGQCWGRKNEPFMTNQRYACVRFLEIHKGDRQIKLRRRSGLN